MRLSDDRGLSLAEFVVAISLLVIVLGISYGALQAVYKGAEVAERQATFARDIGIPLGYLEKVISQHTVIENPTAYSASFITDMNNDNVRERHIVSAGADGRLRDQVWLVNSSGANTSLFANYTWSHTNANQARAVPLFRYLTAETSATAAAEITNMANVPGSARNVIITVVSQHGGQSLRDSRRVLLRNR